MPATACAKDVEEIVPACPLEHVGPVEVRSAPQNASSPRSRRSWWMTIIDFAVADRLRGEVVPLAEAVERDVLAAAHVVEVAGSAFSR